MMNRVQRAAMIKVLMVWLPGTALACLAAWVFYISFGKGLYLHLRANLELNPIPSLVDALDDGSELVRSVTISELSRRGQPAIPALLDAARDPNWVRREGSAIVLGRIARFGRADPSVLKNEGKPILVEMLQDQKRLVRVQAANALWQIDQDAGEVLPVLVDALGDDERVTVYYACSTLETIGPAAKEAIPRLTQLKAGDDDNKRAWATSALSAIDPDSH